MIKKDINKELFKRYIPKNKLAIINSLSEEELLNIKPDTIIRIIKETGEFQYKSKRDRQMYLDHSRRVGNDWNSWVVGLDYTKGKIWLDVYIQYSNTDTNEFVLYEEFMKPDKFRGSIEYTDRYGGSQTEYYTYNTSDKAKCIKAILLEYISRKYKDKNLEKTKV